MLINSLRFRSCTSLKVSNKVFASSSTDPLLKTKCVFKAPLLMFVDFTPKAPLQICDISS